MRMIEANGITLAVDDRGEGPVVVLLHGFPELAYSWRHQLPALVDAGFRVIALDQRGYGASDKPDDVGAYGHRDLAGDVVGVMDRLGIATATVVGHDWGSLVAFATTVLYPDRVERLVTLNVPYLGDACGFPPIDVMREKLADRFWYVLGFQEEGAAEAGFASDPVRWLQAFYRRAARDPGFLSDEEFGVYLDAFVTGGITGPVSWYRNIDANIASMADHRGDVIAQPTLLIAADADPVLPLSISEGMDQWVPDLERIVIANCGHWTQQEQPEAVNDALIGWLSR